MQANQNESLQQINAVSDANFATYKRLIVENQHSPSSYTSIQTYPDKKTTFGMTTSYQIKCVKFLTGAECDTDYHTVVGETLAVRKRDKQMFDGRSIEEMRNMYNVLLMVRK